MDLALLFQKAPWNQYPWSTTCGPPGPLNDSSSHQLKTRKILVWNIFVQELIGVSLYATSNKLQDHSSVEIICYRDHKQHSLLARACFKDCVLFSELCISTFCQISQTQSSRPGEPLLWLLGCTQSTIDLIRHCRLPSPVYIRELTGLWRPCIGWILLHTCYLFQISEHTSTFQFSRNITMTQSIDQMLQIW